MISITFSNRILIKKDFVYLHLFKIVKIRKNDVQDFLDQFEKQLTLHTFNGKEYYSADNLRQTINATE